MPLHSKRRKRRRIALSAKKDLTQEDIDVAVLLVLDNAISALKDCKLNCNRSSLIQRQVTTCNASGECVAAEERITTAFDRIASLPKRETQHTTYFPDSLCSVGIGYL